MKMFDPMLSTMATPMGMRNTTGSNQEWDVTSRMATTIATAAARMSLTSPDADCCMATVLTRLPDSAGSAPASRAAARTRATLSWPSRSSTTSWKRNPSSVFHAWTAEASATSSGSFTSTCVPSHITSSTPSVRESASARPSAAARSMPRAYSRTLGTPAPKVSSIWSSARVDGVSCGR